MQIISEFDACEYATLVIFLCLRERLRFKVHHMYTIDKVQGCLLNSCCLKTVQCELVTIWLNLGHYMTPHSLVEPWGLRARSDTNTLPGSPRVCLTCYDA